MKSINRTTLRLPLLCSRAGLVAWVVAAGCRDACPDQRRSIHNPIEKEYSYEDGDSPCGVCPDEMDDELGTFPLQQCDVREFNLTVLCRYWDDPCQGEK
jgi:hypothetical protein